MAIMLRGPCTNSLQEDVQGRSPFKYKNCRLCISLERNIWTLQESLGFQ